MMDPADIEPYPLGKTLDDLGVKARMGPEHKIVECLVIARTMDFSADRAKTGLVITSSDGLDWIGELGLLAAATAVCQSSAGEDDEDDRDDFL